MRKDTQTVTCVTFAAFLLALGSLGVRVLKRNIVPKITCFTAREYDVVV